MSETEDEPDEATIKLAERALKHAWILSSHQEQFKVIARLIVSERREAATRIASLTARVSELRTELNQTREVCSLVRRQDYFNVPTPVLVEAQIEAERWRVLQETAETIDERRPPIDGVLSRYRARSLIPKP